MAGTLIGDGDEVARRYRIEPADGHARLSRVLPTILGVPNPLRHALCARSDSRSALHAEKCMYHSKIRGREDEIRPPCNSASVDRFECRDARHGSVMKPAPFQYHAPRTIDEAVACWPRSRRSTDVSWQAARAWCRSWHSDCRGRRISLTSTALRRCGGLRSRATGFASAPASGMRLSIVPSWRAAGQAVGDGGAPHRSLIPSARAGPFAAAWPMPTRLRSGARSPPRSAPRWWREHPRDARHSRPRVFRRHHDDEAERGRTADRSALAAAAARHPVRLLRIQSSGRRFRLAMALAIYRVRDGGSSRRGLRSAAPRPMPATDRRCRAGTGGACAGADSFHGRGRPCRGVPSTRWKMRTRARNIAAISFAPSPVVHWNSRF